MDDKLKELREAWLDVPFDGVVEKANGEWIQRLINAASAIVDPDRTLRETPEAQRRGRIASYRTKHAWWSEQATLSEAHGMTEKAADAASKRDQIAAECLAEYGIALE